MADCLRILAQVLWERDDYLGARRHAEESLKTFRELGDRLGTAAALRFLGFLTATEEKYAEAIAPFEESLGLARELDDRRGIAWSLQGLGFAADQANVAEGRARTWEALALFRALGDRAGIACVLVALGIGSADTRRAIRLLAAAQALLEAIGIPLPATFRVAYTGKLRALKQSVPEGIFISEWEEGRAMMLEQAIEYVLRDSPEE